MGVSAGVWHSGLRWSSGSCLAGEHSPAQVGMSYTARDDSVHPVSHSRRSSRCVTLNASIHDPTVTSAQCQTAEASSAVPACMSI